ncbi:hypothetical protein LOTGIDRAFT_234737, partial [Lottia gigantea]
MGLKTENTDGEEKMTSKEISVPKVSAETRENRDDGSTDVDLIGSTENLNTNLPPELVPPPLPVLGHPVHVRNPQDRPHSAHVHRVCGLLLRAMGDQYECNSCGRTLRTLGDEMSTLYNMRRVAST